MVKKCYHCNQETKEVKEIYKQKLGKKTVIIKNTPMIYCDSCNEYFIDAKVSNNIDRIIELIEKQKINNKLLYLDNQLMVINHEDII